MEVVLPGGKAPPNDIIVGDIRSPVSTHCDGFDRCRSGRGILLACGAHDDLTEGTRAEWRVVFGPRVLPIFHAMVSFFFRLLA